jgi:hypothetical protein
MMQVVAAARTPWSLLHGRCICFGALCRCLTLAAVHAAAALQLLTATPADAQQIRSQRCAPKFDGDGSPG